VKREAATDSSPLAAAVRELQEETDYLADSMVQLSPLHVNPATHTNSIWPVLGFGARHVQSPALNATENAEVVRADIGDISAGFTAKRAPG
jgi:8-oxo-dGTP pyrophosphatase MutT (NUDIX family)